MNHTGRAPSSEVHLAVCAWGRSHVVRCRSDSVHQFHRRRQPICTSFVGLSDTTERRQPEAGLFAGRLGLWVGEHMLPRPAGPPIIVKTSPLDQAQRWRHPTCGSICARARGAATSPPRYTPNPAAQRIGGVLEDRSEPPASNCPSPARGLTWGASETGEIGRRGTGASRLGLAWVEQRVIGRAEQASRPYAPGARDGRGSSLLAQSRYYTIRDDRQLISRAQHESQWRRSSRTGRSAVRRSSARATSTESGLPLPDGRRDASSVTPGIRILALRINVGEHDVVGAAAGRGRTRPSRRPCA